MRQPSVWTPMADDIRLYTGMFYLGRRINSPVYNPPVIFYNVPVIKEGTNAKRK